MKQEEKGKDYCKRGRSFDSFERSFQVPEGIDTDKIAAGFKWSIVGDPAQERGSTEGSEENRGERADKAAAGEQSKAKIDAVSKGATPCV
jgi:hypothetical protein